MSKKTYLKFVDNVSSFFVNDIKTHTGRWFNLEIFEDAEFEFIKGFHVWKGPAIAKEDYKGRVFHLGEELPGDIRVFRLKSGAIRGYYLADDRKGEDDE